MNSITRIKSTAKEDAPNIKDNHLPDAHHDNIKRDIKIILLDRDKQIKHILCILA